MATLEAEARSKHEQVQALVEQRRQLATKEQVRHGGAQRARERARETC